MVLLHKSAHKMDSGGLGELLYYLLLICMNASSFATLTSLVVFKQPKMSQK